MNVKLCQKLFLHLLRWSYNFYSSICQCVSHWLWILNHPCIPGINLTWLCCIILLMYYWIQCADILLRIFAPITHQWYWLIIFFFCDIFVWFWYQGDGGLVEWIWECSSLCNFLKSLRRIGVSSSLNVW